MGQPNPPGDNVPLIEGLGAEWNDIVSSFPEDRRGDLGNILKTRVSSYEPLKEYQQFQQAGISAEQLNTAANLFTIIERNPRQVYDTIGEHLGLTAQETKELVADTKQELKDQGVDPRIATLQQQVETMSQIMLAQRQQEQQSMTQREADQELDNNLKALGNKVGDFDEEEVVMRMLQKGISAEEAYNEYTTKFAQPVRRAAPMVMGQGGLIPARAVDTAKLSSQDTKALVAQMMTNANTEAAR